MSSYRLLLCAMLVLGGTAARAADAPKPTVAQYLATCDGAMTAACTLPIDINMTAIAMTENLKGEAATGICLPTDADFLSRAHSEVFAWLKAHAEVAQKSEDDGIVAAATALYPCS